GCVVGDGAGAVVGVSLQFTLAYFFTDQVEALVADIHHLRRWGWLAALVVAAAIVVAAWWRSRQRFETETTLWRGATLTQRLRNPAFLAVDVRVMLAPAIPTRRPHEDATAHRAARHRESSMNILKALAVKDIGEATRAIPVIDFGPAFRGKPGGLEVVAQEVRRASQDV